MKERNGWNSVFDSLLFWLVVFSVIATVLLVVGVFSGCASTTIYDDEGRPEVKLTTLLRQADVELAYGSLDDEPGTCPGRVMTVKHGAISKAFAGVLLGALAGSAGGPAGAGAGGLLGGSVGSLLDRLIDREEPEADPQ